MRRQAIAQRTETRRQHINREAGKAHRIVVYYRHPSPTGVETRATAGSNAASRQHQPTPTTHSYPPPPPQFNNILHYQPPSPPHNQFFQPPPPPPPQLDKPTPKARSPTTCNSHHGFPITEPHPHQNTTETWAPTNFLCATKSS
jgi:hypothetical protein